MSREHDNSGVSVEPPRPPNQKNKCVFMQYVVKLWSSFHRLLWMLNVCVLTEKANKQNHGRKHQKRTSPNVISKCLVLGLSGLE